ncbi:hypothetical protein PIROE2DRAFT_11551, partial [Piromyces sp. E2]
ISDILSDTSIVEHESSIIINEEDNIYIENVVGEKINNNNEPKIRQSNFELLRIIAILLIITHHFAVHGGMEFDTKKVFFNRLWIQFITIGGKMSVNVFILISGYFLIYSKKFKIKKFLKFELQMIMYSIIEYLIGVYVFKLEELKLNALQQNLLPLSNNVWWFASSYIQLYLLFPLINICVHGLNRAAYRKYLILISLFFSVIPTIFHNSPTSYLTWFGFLYFIAGYIRKYSVAENSKSIIWFILAIVIYIITFLTAVYFDFQAIPMEKPRKEIIKYTDYFFDLTLIPAFFASIFLFLGFLNLNIKSRFINFISTTTFGIYLIHDYPMSREIIWKIILKVPTYTNSIYIVPYTIFSVLAVFVVCMIIEIIRIHTIEKLYMKPLDYISSLLENLIKKYDDLELIEEL